MSNPGTESFIEYRNINLKLKDQQLFQDFNLSIAKGEAIQLKGPSGRGKSTLLKMLPGFIRPDGGSILLNGQKLHKHNLKDFRASVSYVSQDTDLRNLPVSELFKEILDFKVNKHISISKEEILSLMADFRLEASAYEKTVRELSGGERQRLGIVITLILDRDIWLLDEVTSGLDPDLKKLAVRTLLSRGKTILVCSHDREWEEDARVRAVEL